MRWRPLHVVLACAAMLWLGMHRVEVGMAVLPDGSVQRIDSAKVREIGSERWPGWLALALDDRRPSRGESRSMLGLDDGQRLSGEFEGIGQELWWRHRELGSMQIDLERLAWIGPPTLALTAPPPRDRLLLVNGDRVEGFVNAMHADRGVEVETPGAAPGDAPTRTWHDLGKAVAAIQLVPRGHPSTGWRLWLQDGSVIDVDAWQREGERLVLQGCHLPGLAASVTMPWDSLVAVQDARRAVRALATGAWTSQDMADTPRLAPASANSPDRPGSLDLRPIDLRGPGTFAVPVPGASCMIDLVLEPAPALGSDVDCTVTLLDGDRTLLSATFKGDAKPVRVHTAVQSGSLRVRLDSGARAAYGCGVRLSDALVVSPVTEPAASIPQPSSAPAKPAASGAPGSG